MDSRREFLPMGTVVSVKVPRGAQVGEVIPRPSGTPGTVLINIEQPWDGKVIREVTPDQIIWYMGGKKGKDLIHMTPEQVELFAKAYPAQPAIDNFLVEEPKPLKHDSLGRGLKGYAHGGVNQYNVTKTNKKTGKVWRGTQWQYEYHDAKGKHRTKYISKKKPELLGQIRDAIAKGATVNEILETFFST